MLKEPVQIKVLVFGPEGAGKSSITYRVSSDSFLESTISTHGVDTRQKKIEKNGQRFLLRFWDVSTIENFEESSNLILREASIALLVCDIQKKTDLTQMASLNEQIKKKSCLLLPYALPTVLVLNKVDLHTKDNDYTSEAHLRQFTLAHK
mgnify:CR=1 FL=1